MSIIGIDGKKRCFGGQLGKEFYGEYHDREWGIPVHDDQRLFELLILEGAQAGLSWETILKKRSAYRKCFYDFDPLKVSQMTDAELEALCKNQEIIRNRLKIYSTRKNALVFLEIQKKFTSFDRYLWGFVNMAPIEIDWRRLEDVPTTSSESIALSKDLRKQGMTFVGPTIMYAYMQAAGLIRGHLVDCWCSRTQ